MKNQDYAQLIATGLPIRITTGQGGWARVYIGDAFESFRRNWDIASTLTAKAPNAKPNSHLGRALANLAARINEARKAHAAIEAKELAAATPQGAPTARAKRI